jgi:PilZ domain
MRVSRPAARPAPTTGPAGSAIQNSQTVSPAYAADPDWPDRNLPRGITRVPTHTVGRANERRAFARARLSLPLRLERVAGQRHTEHYSLQTANISSSGLFFLSPLRIEAGTPIELDVQLIGRPVARATVHMSAMAHVVRSEPAEKIGWYGVAAAFDDISYRRDENLVEPFMP